MSTYYVDNKAAAGGCGSKEMPFTTISEAARIACPGDEVIVRPGIYRECVDPANGGRENARIIYRSEVPLAAVITGAEILSDWQSLEDNVWTARVPASVFGDFNPYKERVHGDWFIDSYVAHLGDVYLNGKSMYEALSLDEVRRGAESEASWDKAFSVYKWYAEEDGDYMVFYANFHELDPNGETVEFSVRRACFAPSEEGIGYITLSGFTVCKAATQWAPPTAYQEGMIAPHWSRGWIIEDCEIYESKCSGISLGKYLQTNNDNKWSNAKYKDGTQTERDCICQAQREGWSKETIGSHIVRRCNIHDCGQTGIVGHLGGVFSVIEDCHIHHINNKQNLAGAEIGGIKMHAAIDVVYRRNHIHHCTRGMWLDWQAQGTRVTQCLFHDNALPMVDDNTGGPHKWMFDSMGEDIFIEVSHGPTLIDNNILLSDRAIKIATQGVAVVHNLISGGLVSVGIGTDNGAKTMTCPRYTPYHIPHRTEIAGFMTFLHGDDRFYNNIFLQKPVRKPMKDLMDALEAEHNNWDDSNVYAGLHKFDDYPTEDEWKKEFEGYCGMGAEPSDRYYMHLPVWAAGNLYLNGARPWNKEERYAVVKEKNFFADAEESAGKWSIVTNITEENIGGTLEECVTGMITTDILGMAFEPEQLFENPDGTPIYFDTDYYGNKRSGKIIAGPFARLEQFIP